MNNFFTGRTEKLFTEEMLVEISHGLTEQDEERCRKAINEVISALKCCGFETRKNSLPKYSSQQDIKE